MVPMEGEDDCDAYRGDQFRFQFYIERVEILGLKKFIISFLAKYNYF